MGSAQRDDGLRRISTVTRWVAAGGIVVAGLLAAAVAKAAPGRSSPASSSSPTSPSSPPPSAPGDQSQLQQPSVPDQGSAGLSPPAEPPLHSRRGGSVSSGGS